LRTVYILKLDALLPQFIEKLRTTSLAPAAALSSHGRPAFAGLRRGKAGNPALFRRLNETDDDGEVVLKKDGSEDLEKAIGSGKIEAETFNIQRSTSNIHPQLSKRERTRSLDESISVFVASEYTVVPQVSFEKSPVV